MKKKIRKPGSAKPKLKAPRNPGHKRARQREFAIAERRRRVMEEYLKRKTQREIADELGVDQKTVCNDIHAIEAQWRDESLDFMDLYKRRSLMDLERLMRTLDVAWERSTTPKVVRRQTQKMSPPVKDDKGKVLKGAEVIEQQAFMETQEQAGDPRFRTAYMEALRETFKLLGLYAPNKQALTNPAGDGPPEDLGVHLVFHVGSQDQ